MVCFTKFEIYDIFLQIIYKFVIYLKININLYLIKFNLVFNLKFVSELLKE